MHDPVATLWYGRADVANPVLEPGVLMLLGLGVAVTTIVRLHRRRS